MKLLLFAI